jgi:DNA polymerase-3 subunit alpha
MLNNFVYARAFVREGWTNRETGKKGEPRLQFNNFQLLHDVMEAYAKKLSIQLNIKALDKQKIQDLQDLLIMHKGKHNLNFVVYDDDEELKVELKSRKQKVQISQELLTELQNQNIFYKLN